MQKRVEVRTGIKRVEPKVIAKVIASNASVYTLAIITCDFCCWDNPKPFNISRGSSVPNFSDFLVLYGT